TRLDPYAGFQQYIVAASRLIMGETTSSINGKTTEFDGKYGHPTREDVVSNFGRSKLAPLVSFADAMMRGKDPTGQPFHMLPNSLDDRGKVADLFIPLLIQDVMDLAASDPKLLPLAIPAGFGMGLQTYQKK